MTKYIPYYFFFLLIPVLLTGQKLEDAEIKQLVKKYKQDPRGPYKDIRWFCPDGTINMPREPCSEKGGEQHARYKDSVDSLAASNHIFLGQILAGTKRNDFWDPRNNNSRLKQYQLEKYLRRIDDGWILRKGQYYRGAFQEQDEKAWGKDFLIRLMSSNKLLKQRYFLIRQAVKDIPHGGANFRTEKVWAMSKEISNSYPDFLTLRIKIHGQPDATDLPKVIAFKEEHKANFDVDLRTKFDKLIAIMEEIYQPTDLSFLEEYLEKLPPSSEIRMSLDDYVCVFDTEHHSIAMLMATAEKAWEIRDQILTIKSRRARLALLDISLALEEIFFREINSWEAGTLEELLDKTCYSGMMLAGTGFVEQWEWNMIGGELAAPEKEEFSLGELLLYLENARRLVEWGAGMPRGVYQDVVELYAGFEPLANGFYDERIRNSVLLSLGQSVGQLGAFIAREANYSNQVMAVENPSTFRGLNPGYAMGKLVVVSDETDIKNIDQSKIYVFNRPPPDLNPVAGIATVSEGSMVSHIQLLARNLGIPNAVLSRENLIDLKEYDGQEVFYAVSNKGTVILKPKNEMTFKEEQLFTKRQRSKDKVRVPTEKIDLSQTKVINLRTIDATASGKICGPKAANLGQLKKMFPDKVVEGIVIPFGVFRQHLNQRMPRREVTYWDFLKNIFIEANQMKLSNTPDEVIEIYVLKELNVLRAAFKKIKLRSDFITDLKESFQEAFGAKIGKVPVFVRSDTNMEDLKEFTGAGLNRTLFNVVSFDKILKGIREVWASPYTERSFKWRQQYLLNPENVFPSILIIPSVDVDHSGVLITTGVSTGDEYDLTVAFSRGAGGAVDGQAAESWLLKNNNENTLLSPARESSFRKLPKSGGTSKKVATFDRPILTKRNKYDLRVLAYEVYEKLADTPGIDGDGPFDIELGFKNDHIWLFQIRPFVENKNAKTSEYLKSITPVIDEEKKVSRKALLKKPNS